MNEPSETTGKVSNREKYSAGIKVGMVVKGQEYEQDDDLDEKLRKEWLKNNKTKKEEVSDMKPKRLSNADFDKLLKEEKKKCKPKVRSKAKVFAIGVSLDESLNDFGN